MNVIIIHWVNQTLNLKVILDKFFLLPIKSLAPILVNVLTQISLEPVPCLCLLALTILHPYQVTWIREKRASAEFLLCLLHLFILSSIFIKYLLLPGIMRDTGNWKTGDFPQGTYHLVGERKATRSTGNGVAVPTYSDRSETRGHPSIFDESPLLNIISLYFNAFKKKCTPLSSALNNAFLHQATV